MGFSALVDFLNIKVIVPLVLFVFIITELVVTNIQNVATFVTTFNRQLWISSNNYIFDNSNIITL
ncbi:MAG: hypothetical protein Tsb0033_15440 [Winogradskyella sp.]